MESETQIESDLSSYCSATNFETSDNSIATQDDVKIKVEIELKEAENDLVYQPDFYGRLRLVNLNQITDSSNDLKNKEPDVRDWTYFHESLSKSQVNEEIIIPTDESNIISVQSAFEHLNNIYGFSKERMCPNLSSFQGSVFSSSVLYNSLHKDLCKQDFPEHIQDADYVRRKKELSSILAEKKRNYRNKIKEENPAMWSAMKQKEACKKREQREEKRFILLEMQRMMHLLSLPESSETEKNRACLQTLRERYPDIWKQLLDALSAAEQRNSDLLERTTCNRKRSKPIRAYKDIVEAQKKYLYRQRMKLERPDLYEQQKARDSYARSIRRMLKKQFVESQNIVNNGVSDINNLNNHINSKTDMDNNMNHINIDNANNSNDDSNLNEIHNVKINV